MNDPQATDHHASHTPDVSTSRELLALIGHELRTPLNSILGFSQLITMDDEVSEKVSRWASTAHDAGLSLTHMIDSLLLFAATDSLGFEEGTEQSSGLVLVPSAINLSILLTRIGTDVSSLFDEPRSVVTTHVADNIGELVTSERHLRFAIDHLVRNAAQYAEAAPIHLEAAAMTTGASATIQLTIEDEGPGIPAGQYARHATPFTRGDGVAGIGLGLGIPIAERIVTRLGGTIRYENPASGPSTFIIELPPQLKTTQQHQSPV